MTKFQTAIIEHCRKNGNGGRLASHFFFHTFNERRKLSLIQKDLDILVEEGVMYHSRSEGYWWYRLANG